MNLGIVEFVREGEGDRPEWCRFRPIYRADGGSWKVIGEKQRNEEFATQGLIFWYGPPIDAKEYTAWVITPKRKQHADPARFSVRKQPDYFEVDTHHRPCLLVEFGKEFDRTDLRRRCATGAFVFRVPPPAPFAIKLPGAEDQWVGPVNPVFEKRAEGRYVGQHDVPLGFLDIYSVDHKDLQRIRLNGIEYTVLRPVTDFGLKVGRFSAQGDEQLLAGILRRIRRLDHEAAEALRITDNMVAEYVRLLGGGALLGDEAESFDLAREEAVRLLMEQVKEESEFLSKVADALVAHPNVQRRLDAAVADMVKESAKQIEAQARQQVSELSDQVTAKRAELGEVQSEYESKRQKIVEFDTKLREKKGEIDQLTGGVEGALEAAVSRMLDDPVAELSQHSVVRALLRVTQGSKPVGIRAVQLAAKPGSQVADLSGVRGALLAGASALDQDPHVGPRCVASLLAGRLTLLAGLRASETADLVGRILSGVNCRTVHVPTHVFGVDDLLNLPALPADPDQPVSPLGEVLVGATDVDCLTCIVLRGVNRSPLEAAVLDLVEGAVARHDSNTLPWSRGGGTTLRVPREPRVALLGTLADGPSVFRVPRELRQLVSLVWSDRSATGGADLKLGAPPDLFVTASDWLEWSSLPLSLDHENLERILEPLRRDVLCAGYERELSAFLSLFDGDVRGVGEWLIARFGGILDLDLLREVGSRAGAPAGAAVDEAEADGTIGAMEILTESGRENE